MDKTRKSEPGTASLVEQLSDLMRGLRPPGVDVNEILASQKKNIDAYAKAMQTAAEGAGAVARRQAEMLKTAIDQIMAMTHEMTVPGNPKETVAKQGEFITRALETTMANTRELAEMIEKSNRTAFEVIRERTAEALHEIRTSLTKKKSD